MAFREPEVPVEISAECMGFGIIGEMLILEGGS